MSYAEDILKLRSRVAEAVSAGALDGSKETLEAILIQIMNDAERNRQNCVTQAETVRKQAATLDGQAAAFSSVVSSVYNVINAFVKIAEKSREEEARVAAEQAEKSEAVALEKASETKKKGAKKGSKSSNQ